MKKKILILINIIILIIFCTYMIIVVENGENLKAEVISDREYEKICDVLTKTDEDILCGLTFNGYELPFSKNNNTYYLPLSMADDKWENGELLSKDKDISVYFLENISDTDKSKAIAENKNYSFIACTKEKYKEYNLVFTGLPMMEISINGEAADESYDINMNLYLADTKSDWIQSSNAILRVRGNTSRLYPKKAYKMELYNYNASNVKKDNALSLLGMRKDNDWILYAMYNDETKVRDKLSLDIWNEYGATDNPYNGEFGAKMEYVELIMNGEYMGLYGLMEPVDSKKLDITAQSSVGTAEYIYKRTTPVVLSLDEFTDLSAITQCGFELKGLSKYGNISAETWSPLIDYVKMENMQDDEGYKTIAQNMLDIDNVTDVWLYLQIITGFDNRGKNMYYVSKAYGDSRKMYFVPWDLDLTWGNVSKETPPLYTAFEGNELCEELVDWQPGDRCLKLDINDSRKKLINKWHILRQGIVSDENLVKMIEELENTVINSGAMKRDEIRWQEGAHTFDFSIIKQYALDRMSFLDKCFER